VQAQHVGVAAQARHRLGLALHLGNVLLVQAQVLEGKALVGADVNGLRVGRVCY
jgi:hypothetical protein